MWVRMQDTTHTETTITLQIHPSLHPAKPKLRADPPEPTTPERAGGEAYSKYKRLKAAQTVKTKAWASKQPQHTISGKFLRVFVTASATTAMDLRNWDVLEAGSAVSHPLQQTNPRSTTQTLITLAPGNSHRDLSAAELIYSHCHAALLQPQSGGIFL